jgi:hypothetical protein
MMMKVGYCFAIFKDSDGSMISSTRLSMNTMNGAMLISHLN